MRENKFAHSFRNIFENYYFFAVECVCLFLNELQFDASNINKYCIMFKEWLG